MTMNRAQLRVLTAKARYLADKQKPPTRRQAQAWLQPIRQALAEMRTGQVDAIRGYAVTRLHQGDDYARIDWCINGFAALIERLMPDLDISPMATMSKKLGAGIPLTLESIDACSAVLNTCEDRLIKLKRCDLIDAALIEQVKNEFDRLNLREAA